MLAMMPIILQSQTPHKARQSTHNQWPTQLSFWYGCGSEFIYGCWLMAFYHCDLPALKNTFVYCKQCDYPVNIFYTQSCCLFDQKHKALKAIRALLYKGDPEKIIAFLLKFHTHYQSECPCCKSYYGWERKEA